jgi:hypothetical protein
MLSATSYANVVVNGDFANDIAIEPSGGNMAGPGFSTSDGSNYFPDAWFAGDQDEGLWQSSLAGRGSIDTLQPGGVTSGPFTLAAGIPDLPADGNDRFLGLFKESANQEYAAAEVSIVTPGMYQLSYWWANAAIDVGGATNFSSNAQIEFFVDSDGDYSNGGRSISEFSTIESFDGAGNQIWHHVTRSILLPAGTHWFGFANVNNDTYVAIDAVVVSPVPEPSNVILAAMLVVFMLRYKRI